jgi:serine protease Do
MKAIIPPRRRGLFVAAALAALTFLSPVSAQPWLPPPSAKSSPEVLKAYLEVVAAPSQSTVRVLCDGKEAALGTVVFSDGYIVTKASLLKGKIVVKLKDGKTHDAKVVGVEDRHDLAMLQVKAKALKPIQWAHSKTAEVGNLLAAPGIGEKVEGKDKEEKAVVGVGVVSVATRKPSAREMTMMAPSENAGFMGVLFDVERPNVPAIGEVVPRGPAAKAGLKPGDVILRVQGRKMTDPDRVIEAVYGYKPGDAITLRVKRGDDEKVLRVVLGQRPRELIDRSDRMNVMGSPLSSRRGGFPTILQHDMVIKPADCGGPLVDLDGKAVGINIARAGRTESFAIPSEEVEKLLKDLKLGNLAPAALVDDAKIYDLEQEVRLSTEGIARAKEALDEADDADEKKKLRDRIDTLRKKIDDAQQALNKLKSDPTKGMK